MKACTGSCANQTTIPPNPSYLPIQLTAPSLLGLYHTHKWEMRLGTKRGRGRAVVMGRPFREEMDRQCAYPPFNRKGSPLARVHLFTTI